MFAFVLLIKRETLSAVLKHNASRRLQWYVQRCNYRSVLQFALHLLKSVATVATVPNSQHRQYWATGCILGTFATVQYNIKNSIHCQMKFKNWKKCIRIALSSRLLYEWVFVIEQAGYSVFVTMITDTIMNVILVPYYLTMVSVYRLLTRFLWFTEVTIGYSRLCFVLGYYIG